MNDSVRDTLKRLITQHGTDLCSNRQRLEGMLRDFCGQHKREVTVLVAAAREGVAEELLHVDGAQVDVLLVKRLIRRLHEDAAIDERVAAWAVESWATALGKEVPTESAPAPPPSSPVTPPTAKPTDSSVLPSSTEAAKRRWPWQQPQQPTPPPEPAPEAARVPTSTSGQTKTNPKDNAPMVWIPAGEFLMGGNEYDNEKPPHNVYLDGYWMYKHPVTVAQYRKFCQATNRQMPGAPSWGWRDDHPVVNVTWNDATAYAQWAGMRLPTEAEWEKAARGTDGRMFPWGNNWDRSKCANSVGINSLTSTKPVGSYPQGASPYGCMDMAGNVSEWCADWYGSDYYPSSPSKKPPGPSSGAGRVLRGGSWCKGRQGYFRCSYRGRDLPSPVFRTCVREVGDRLGRVVCGK